jgi:hypothetical protein
MGGLRLCFDRLSMTERVSALGMAADTGLVAKAPRSMSVQPGPQGNARPLRPLKGGTFDYS